MPVPLFNTVIQDGPEIIPYFWTLVKLIPWALVLYGLKYYFSGVSNTSERTMHGKVIMMTGGTSGIGAAIARDLASRGAQLVLLTQHPLSDPFIVDYITDLREDTSNELITAEQVDLSSLHSIRSFATKWIDNAPPRRLDTVILCANTLTAPGKGIESTKEAVELNWMVNYLGNFHLLSILSPALRAQPPDRDVRVLFATCTSYMGGDLTHISRGGTAGRSEKDKKDATVAAQKFSPSIAYATSKYALTAFALAFQKHLSAFERPDKMPMNTKVFLVDPGFCRTPGMRRWLTRGSLFGLLVYLLAYPIVWLVLKSPEMGAQSFLFAAMDEGFARGEGGWYIKECGKRTVLRDDVKEEDLQQRLWEYSEKMVQEGEKRGIEVRAKEKRENKDKEDEAEAVKEMNDYREKVGKRKAAKTTKKA